MFLNKSKTACLCHPRPDLIFGVYAPLENPQRERLAFATHAPSKSVYFKKRNKGCW